MNLTDLDYKILSIDEVDFGKEIGYVITLIDHRKHIYQLNFMIDSHQQCCENFGYFTVEDNLDDFLGATVNEITFVHYPDGKIDVKSLNETLRGEYGDVSVDDCVFVRVATNRGCFHLTIYNEHNGYYGHNICASFNKLIEEAVDWENIYM